MKLSTLAGVTAVLSLISFNGHAQDESQRFRSGQVKVGDVIGANPTHNGPMDPCVVTEIVPDPVRKGYDGDYVVKCDKAPWTRVSATGDHARIMPQTTQPTAAPALSHTPASSPQLNLSLGPAARPAPVHPATAPAARAANGGNAFGSRDPRSCAPVTGGTPSAASAAALVACSREAQTRQHEEWLVSNVRVTSMQTSTYNPYTQTGFTNMDTGVAPIAIVGTLDSWQCREQDPPTVLAKYSNVGANCSHHAEGHATGYCYKMRTGAWSCSMWDTNPATTKTEYNVPPPH